MRRADDVSSNARLTYVSDHPVALQPLNAGEQDEEVFRRAGPGDEHHAPLELTERNHLLPGDFYVQLYQPKYEKK